MKNKPNLTRRFFYSLLLVAIASISLIGFIWLRDHYSEFQVESELMREQFLISHRTLIRSEVDKTAAYIHFKEAQIEKQLKESIKNRVYEAHAITNNLYEQYQGKRDLPEIKKMVKDALRPIRFNNGRGYYFAFDLNGVEELFADRPEMEGKNMLSVQGAKGEFVVRDMLQMAKKNSEGFYKYTWTKPNKKGFFPKIAFIKIFKPFNWVIGTGEYLDDVESDIQKEVINFIEQISYGNGGYVFAGTWDGLTLSGPAKGKNNWEVTDVNGIKVVQKLIGLAKKGNGFLEYVMPKLDDKRPAPKLSYVVGVPKWKWYVGTGIYIDEIETAIDKKKKLLKKSIISHVVNISLILVFIILVVSFVAIQIAKKMKNNFDLFSRFFDKAATESATINPDMMDFAELENLAHSAKDMIEARKKAEEGLKASEEKYRDLVENINEVIYATDKKGILTYISPVIESQVAYSVSELVGRTLKEFVHPEDLPRFEKQFQDILSGSSKQGEYRVLTKSNDARWIHHSSRPIYVKNQVIGVRGSFTDITKSKRLQAQLKQAEKMESMGLMAGGIAHDLNNILSGIVSYPDLLLADLPKNSKLRKPLKIIKESGYRAADVVSDLLTIARGVETSKQIFNLNILIKEYLDSAEQLKIQKTYSSITFKTQLDTELFNINCSIIHISKILMNLIGNASESIEGIGTVTISTTNRYLDQPLKGYKEVRIGEYVMLNIADNGSGISPNDIDRVFEPFYTKKIMGRSGTGLGLTIVWNAVQDHDGYINVKSSDKGSIFELYFPATRERMAAQNDEFPLKNYLGHREKILVVDDEERQREIAIGLLNKLNYTVETASSGEEAVEYLENNSADLVMLDMVMPNGMNGYETYKAILNIHPSQKAIIASGFAETEDIKKTQKLGAGEFIKKPYTLEKLGLAVKEELEKV